jgi:hypothetical protein
MIRKNMAIVLISIFFFQLLPIKATESNIEILDKLNQKAVANIINQIKLFNCKINRLEISEHSSKSFFELKLLTSLDSNKLLSADNTNLLSINIISNNVKYSEYVNNQDSIIRTNEIVLLAKIINTSISIYNFKDLHYSFSDTVNRQDIEYIQAGEYKFTNSPLPTQKKSFWEELTGPAIILGSAIITVFLLFTVRSK